MAGATFLLSTQLEIMERKAWLCSKKPLTAGTSALQQKKRFVLIFPQSIVLNHFAMASETKYHNLNLYSISYKVPRSPTRRNYRRILHNLLQASKDHPLNVVMLFCRQRDVTALLSVYKMVYTSSSIRFVWIASNAWGNRDDVTSGHEHQGDGALTLNHLDAPVNRFEQFLKTLTVDSYSYPWYKEFWQDVKGKFVGNILL